MNKLYAGFSKSVDRPKGGCLLITDDMPAVPRARVFDPARHCFNPLKERPHSLSGTGRRALLRALLSAKTLDKVRGDEELNGLITDIFVSPVLKRVLCSPTNFSFNPNSVIIAKLNRPELGDFHALVLAFSLTTHFRGQLVVEDFGFYGRDVHASLVRENRLIAGVNFLGELAPRLRNSVLLIKEKIGSGATVEDAETLARHERLRPATNAFNEFVDRAMA